MVLEQLQAGKGDPVRLLHVAPERSFQERLQDRNDIEYISLDLDSPLADVHADLSGRTPFSHGSFDLIICSHVLEHIPDDGAAMSEMRRILSSDGSALVMVPVSATRYDTDEDPAASPEERTRRFGQADHVRRYGRDIIDRLERAGFDVQELVPERIVDREVVERARLTQPETGSVFICTGAAFGTP